MCFTVVGIIRFLQLYGESCRAMRSLFEALSLEWLRGNTKHNYPSGVFCCGYVFLVHGSSVYKSVCLGSRRIDADLLTLGKKTKHVEDEVGSTIHLHCVGVWVMMRIKMLTTRYGIKLVHAQYSFPFLCTVS